VCLVIAGLFWKLPFPFTVLGMLAVAPLIIVQKQLNFYWQIEQPNLTIKKGSFSENLFYSIMSTILCVSIMVIVEALKMK
jgi:hypothetical protein